MDYINVCDREMDYNYIISKIIMYANINEDLNGFLKDSLGLIANYLGISFAFYYSYNFREHEIKRVVEWSNNKKYKNKFNKFSCYNVDSFFDEIVSKKIIKIDDVNEIEQEKAKDLLKNNNFKSLIVDTVYTYDELKGFMGFAQFEYNREWNGYDQYLLDTLAMLASQKYKSKMLDDALVGINGFLK